ncbi:pyridoxamine 5'-phosphate oxidase family protein [Micromonospora sp. WMMD729]|uniref:pyridoxamine 5'-phosphate oxidase family protein n=1 Tax=Micromonospora sp. WMMD729 TaxID=3404127 RepID=UPI003BF5926C
MNIDPADDEDALLATSDPIRLTRAWIADAARTGPWSNAVSLATADAAGKVGCRTVLLFLRDDRLYFATSLESRKGRDLMAVPYAAMSAFWMKVRQWRAEGPARLASEELADTLFSEAPLPERLLVRASADGRPQTPDQLNVAYQDCRSRYADVVVPRPGKWRAFQLLPETFEFWEADVVKWQHRCRRFTWDAESASWSSCFVGP